MRCSPPQPHAFRHPTVADRKAVKKSRDGAAKDMPAWYGEFRIRLPEVSAADEAKKDFKLPRFVAGATLSFHLSLRATVGVFMA